MEQDSKPVIIPMKSGSIIFDDIIELEGIQLNKLSEESIKKTKQQWQDSDEGIKVPLTKKQQELVVEMKHAILDGLTPEEIIHEEYLDVAPHAKKRVNYRLENLDPDTPMTLQTLYKIADALLNSVEIRDKAHWKGRQNLTYRFVTNYNSQVVDFAIAFEDGLIIVSVIGGQQAKKEYGNPISAILDDAMLLALRQEFFK